MHLCIFVLIILGAGMTPSTNAWNYTCDDTESNNKPVCECTDDVCYFKLVIEHLQTFTAYEKNAASGTRGRVYYIDSGGNLRPAAPYPKRTACENLQNCTEVHTVDGSTYRSFISVNKHFPGPTLIVNESATVVVDVVNLLTTEETSIHWHGMHQRRTPWMDGVGYITQCPIEGGGSFRYIFKANLAGTFWYHSHSGAQRTDGLFGALIVKENTIPDGLPDFEDIPGNHTLSLLDWQRQSSLDLFVQIHSSLGYYEGIPVDQIPTDANTLYENTCSADGVEVGPIPYWSGIINGKGKHRLPDFNKVKFSRFDVTSGNMYRYRLIGAQGNYAYRFSIDNHKLTLVATDGFFIEPIVTDYIIIHTGERYDFLINATQTGRKYFLMRTDTLEVNCNTLVRDDSFKYNDAIALLTYDGEEVSNDMIETLYINGGDKGCSEGSICTVANCPFENYQSGSGYDCSNMHAHEFKLLVPTPKNELPKSDEVDNDSTRFFNFGFDSVEFTSTINGRNFILPNVSLQTGDSSKVKVCRDLDKECNLEEDDCTCVHIIDIDSSFSGKTFRFVLSSLNTTSGFTFSHPIHLHGHSFHVVKVGYGSYLSNNRLDQPTDDIECGTPCLKPPIWKNNTPPIDIEITNRTIRKDTIIVPAGGYVVIDFITDNPGYWFLHCHIEPHQLEGMALVINELRSDQNPPPEGMPDCGDFTWTVKQFNEKLKGESTGSNGLSSCENGLITMAVFMFIFIIVIVALIYCMCKKSGYQKIPSHTKTHT